MLLVVDEMMGKSKFFFDSNTGFSEAIAYTKELDAEYRKVVYYKRKPNGERDDGSWYHELDYDVEYETKESEDMVESVTFDGEQDSSIRIERVGETGNEPIWEWGDEEKFEEEKTTTESLLMVNSYYVDAEPPVYFKDTRQGMKKAEAYVRRVQRQYKDDALSSRLHVRRITPGCYQT